MGGSGRGKMVVEAEEQGWVARMVHLFKSEDLAVQFEVSKGNSSGGLELMAGVAFADCEKSFPGGWGEGTIYFPTAYCFEYTSCEEIQGAGTGCEWISASMCHGTCRMRIGSILRFAIVIPGAIKS